MFGPVQHLNPSAPDFTATDAQAAYDELLKELNTVGPAVKSSFWAKAYGVQNSGSAGFEVMPWYNDDCHVMDRCIFMNNYGVRTVPEEANVMAGETSLLPRICSRALLGCFVHPFYQRPLGAVACCCFLLLLTCALLMTSSHSQRAVRVRRLLRQLR